MRDAPEPPGSTRSPVTRRADGDLRLRTTEPELVALPWHIPLGEWTPLMAPLRDLPVGPSRHTVRFVAFPSGLYALKELPPRVARHEHALLRQMEARALRPSRPSASSSRRPRRRCS